MNENLKLIAKLEYHFFKTILEAVKMFCSVSTAGNLLLFY